MSKQTFIELLDSFWGGAGTTLFGSLMGRWMWHASEVRKLRRRMFGPELLWELPIVFGMVLIGESVVAYFKLPPIVSSGFVAALAYLGPRGVEVSVERWILRKVDKRQSDKS